jgi:pSer/pThr/pTyr-binding forkhead associated (FHA) protein
MARTRRHSTQVLAKGEPPARRVTTFLIVAPDTPTERRIPLDDKPVTIGTEAGCDVLVTDKHVSRRHAELKRIPEGVLLRDLGSRNGTYVEGMAVKEVILKNGSLLSVGLTQIRCVIEGGATSSSPPTAPPQPTEEGPDHFGIAVGSSPATRKVFALLTKLAPTELTITLIGETGSGKDVLARSVHEQSPRKPGPFVAEPAQARPLRGLRLRRGRAVADRERALRPREGRLHRRRHRAAGRVRARARRHPLPRRGR